jgi:RNA-directed DNA polymerase
MSFQDTLIPPGGVPMERVTDRPIPEHHLLERILSRENLQWAWKRVKANKGAPGVDGVTVEQFPDQTRASWAEIRASLATGSYLPQPVLRVEIPMSMGTEKCTSYGN